MMTFYKYQGTGNDFIMIDNRSLAFDAKDLDRVKKLCDRRFGIGADGLILIQEHTDADFEMVYFNADGSQSFCGNGSRCAVAFAKSLGMIDRKCDFIAIDGDHTATIDEQNQVSIRMNAVTGIEKIGEDLFINTGSPHYIHYVADVNQEDVVAYGKSIRYNDRFKAEGTNVNIVHREGGELWVRTYERGVEDETFSCGTGVTAVAVSAHHLGFGSDSFPIITKGGTLKIELECVGEGQYKNIWLIGPATFVFKGEVDA